MRQISTFMTIALLMGVSHLAMGFDHSHTKFDEVLKRHVSPLGELNVVDYGALKKSPAKLDSYLKDLSLVKKKEFDSWSEPQRLSYLINAYNAFTLKLIIDNYPLKSIKDLGGLFSSPWKKKFFKLFGEKYYLDGIEHEMIRKDFKEPRIHFAVNCASKGCPNLLAEAFVATKLDKQLERATVAFLNDSRRNRLDTKERELQVSSIFKWYGDDFGSKKDLKKFVLSRLKSLETKEINLDKIDIEYLDYDWSLNKK